MSVTAPELDVSARATQRPQPQPRQEVQRPAPDNSATASTPDRSIQTSEAVDQAVQAQPQRPQGESARLRYDQDAEKVIVEILNPNTGDVIIQMPPEKLGERMLQVLTNGATGGVFNTVA